VVVRNGASNAGKPPLFSDGYSPGTVRELGDLYGGSVAVSRKFLDLSRTRII
jgi:hypothetical protein